MMSFHTTQIRVGNGEFAAQMTRMRVWLDNRRFEPAVFRYDQVERAVVIRVDFAVEDEAAAFAQEFAGTMLR
jgi:hypothetical protein